MRLAPRPHGRQWGRGVWGGSILDFDADASNPHMMDQGDKAEFADTISYVCYIGLGRRVKGGESRTRMALLVDA